MTDTTQLLAHAFVTSLLRNGLALSDLCASLVETLEARPLPGDDPTTAAETVIELVTGTIRPLVDSLDPATVTVATDLLESTLDLVLAELRTAAHLAAAREAADRN